MNSYDIVKKLMSLKEKKIYTEEEKKKYEIIKEIIKEKDCFFKINMETAIGILEFLEVEEGEVITLYNSLISIENYERTTPKERINITKKI